MARHDGRVTETAGRLLRLLPLLTARPSRSVPGRTHGGRGCWRQCVLTAGSDSLDAIALHLPLLSEEPSR
jgi:hypothetical protein